MKTQYRILSFCFVLLLPVFLAGCFHKKANDGSDASGSGEQAVNSELFVTQEQELRKNQEFATQATEQRLPELCNNITDEALKKSCIDSIVVAEAAANADVDLCDNASSEDERVRCADNIIFNQAGVEMDEDMCDRISDEVQIKMCKQNVITMKEMADEAGAERMKNEAKAGDGEGVDSSSAEGEMVIVSEQGMAGEGQADEQPPLPEQ